MVQWVAAPKMEIDFVQIIINQCFAAYLLYFDNY